MTKELLLEIGLTEDQADKVLELYEKLAQNFVPKEKLDEVITEKEQLSTSLKERDKQLKDLQASTGDNETLKKQLEEAIAKNKADTEAAAVELSTYKKNNAIDLALMKFGAKNPKTVKVLLELEKISLDGENIIGLNDQLEALKVSDEYLFDNTPDLSGRPPVAGSSGANLNDMKDNPFKKETFNLTKQGELYRKDPELAKKMARATGNMPTWLK